MQLLTLFIDKLWILREYLELTAVLRNKAQINDATLHKKHNK